MGLYGSMKTAKINSCSFFSILTGGIFSLKNANLVLELGSSRKACTVMDPTFLPEGILQLTQSI
jgi:hypothetical protein